MYSSSKVESIFYSRSHRLRSIFEGNAAPDC